MKKLFAFAVLSLATLTACGSVYDGPTQKVTLLTPGAQNAQCTIHNDDFKYHIETGETRNIMRSEHDLIMDCYAPGNREKHVIIERELTDAGLANIANAGFGAIYDYYDNALYEYPAALIVDFTATPPRSYGLPKAHARDLPHPSTTPITTYAPGTPITDFDRMYPQPILQKKEMVVDDGMMIDSFIPEPTQSPLSVMPEPKGTNAEELMRSMNPGVFQ